MTMGLSRCSFSWGYDIRIDYIRLQYIFLMIHLHSTCLHYLCIQRCMKNIIFWPAPDLSGQLLEVNFGLEPSHWFEAGTVKFIWCLNHGGLMKSTLETADTPRNPYMGLPCRLPYHISEEIKADRPFQQNVMVCCSWFGIWHVLDCSCTFVSTIHLWTIPLTKRSDSFQLKSAEVPTCSPAVSKLRAICGASTERWEMSRPAQGSLWMRRTSGCSSTIIRQLGWTKWTRELRTLFASDCNRVNIAKKTIRNPSFLSSVYSRDWWDLRIKLCSLGCS